MNILLCDDDKNFSKSLKLKLSGENRSIFSYDSKQKVLESDTIFDIAFLDIELNDSKGFELVKYLRARNPKCVIAFFTNYHKYAIQGYNYQPFRYILKNEPEIIINKRISEVFREYYRRNKTISGSYSGYRFCVSIDDIYYISISNHITTLHTKKGDFELYKQMKELEPELNKFSFFRCHRSYMVNTQHILLMNKDNFFILDDPKGTVIPIGIKYKKAAEEKYLIEFTVGGR